MKSLVSQIRQNLIILTMGVMMQTFRPSLLEGVHLYVQTKSNGSSFKNEKREREIKSWLLAHLCTPGQLQQEVSCSGDPEAGTCVINRQSKRCFVFVILRWGSSGQCFTSEESDTQIPARQSGRKMSKLREQTKIRGVFQSDFMFQLWQSVLQIHSSPVSDNAHCQMSISLM